MLVDQQAGVLKLQKPLFPFGLILEADEELSGNEGSKLGFFVLIGEVFGVGVGVEEWLFCLSGDGDSVLLQEVFGPIFLLLLGPILLPFVASEGLLAAALCVSI